MDTSPQGKIQQGVTGGHISHMTGNNDTTSQMPACQSPKLNFLKKNRLFLLGHSSYFIAFLIQSYSDWKLVTVTIRMGFVVTDLFSRLTCDISKSIPSGHLVSL